MNVGKFRLRGPLAIWLGHLATCGVSEDPFLARWRPPLATGDRELSGPCTRESLCRGFCPRKLIGTSSVLLGLSAVWDDMERSRFPALRGRRPSLATGMMDSCSAVYNRAGATEAVHKQVRDAGRATVLEILLDGNRGTLSPCPSRALMVLLQSLRTTALLGQLSSACHASRLLE